jgi:hypothetical protein
MKPSEDRFKAGNQVNNSLYLFCILSSPPLQNRPVFKTLCHLAISTKQTLDGVYSSVVLVVGCTCQYVTFFYPLLYSLLSQFAAPLIIDKLLIQYIYGTSLSTTSTSCYTILLPVLPALLCWFPILLIVPHKHRVSSSSH